MCLQILIANGEESHTQRLRSKALLFAVQFKSAQMVRVLLAQLKVNPNFTDNEQMTPLRWAALKGDKSVMKELLLWGATDMLDRFGQNIVFYAARAQNNHLQILQLLQRANADFCVVSFEGQTATDQTNDAQIIQFIQNVRKTQLIQC